MHILGIETSCDETAAAVIKGTEQTVILKSNIIASSMKTHAETGGIIPEVAARQQLAFILPVITQALKGAKITMSELDAIAVTYGPGLIGSLLVGVETARTLSFTNNIPLIPINHMIGHVYANWLVADGALPVQEKQLRATSNELPAFPALALVVSGGHTDLLLLKKHGDIQLLGGTRDDAAGECFDKCARLLGYPYPGGPKISSLAERGDPSAFQFPRPMIGTHDYEFSFSGLKTAFLNTTKKHFPILRTNPGAKIGWQQVALENQLSQKDKQILYDLCASLQKAIIDVLVKKTLRAAKEYKVQSILLSGGVAANQPLRETLQLMINDQQLIARLFAPAKSLCTDNAAMIASAAYFNNHPVPWKEVVADPELYFA